MVKQSSKGQVSLEYLMTYGIAIAIVVIAVAALYSMGVFSPKSSAVACSPCFSNFAYVDYSPTNGILIIKNGPRTLTSVSSSGGTLVKGNASTSISASEQFNITNISTTVGSTVALTLTYTDSFSGLQHTDTATVHN
jgi:uncharacterized protein (UPF0333 family)